MKEYGPVIAIFLIIILILLGAYFSIRYLLTYEREVDEVVIEERVVEPTTTIYVEE